MWITTVNGTTPDGKPVEYQQNKREHDAWAETQARVRLSGRVVHTGWSSDGTTYATYRRLIGGDDAT